MHRSELGVGPKSLARGSTFAAKPKPLKRSRGRRASRSPAERAVARSWHRMIGRLHEGKCVCDCGRPAGEWGHHLIEKQWLRDMGLDAHVWDLEVGVPVADLCHANHTADAMGKAITRTQLVQAGVWDRAVAWAKRLDGIHFADPVHQPVLSRLEREYPA